MPEYAGTAQGEGRRIAVVVARFNETITQKLLEGALDALTRHGVAFDDIDTLWVPGAWEIPFAARRALASDRYDATSSRVNAPGRWRRRVQSSTSRSPSAS